MEAAVKVLVDKLDFVAVLLGDNFTQKSRFSPLKIF
jgi:hypothetical protein